MKLIKVKDGLLEAENFFLVSSFGDFAGEANVSRDISTGKLKIISNNKIERKFNYEEFVIEVEKENVIGMEEDDYSMLYLGNDNYTFGIKDKDLNQQNKYWKILRQENYVQAYSSSDGVNYTNLGGMKFSEPLSKQGFMKISKEDFKINKYKVYDNPYVTIQNFSDKTKCELYNKADNLLKTRVFNSEMECKVFLDSNDLEGYFIFKDSKDSIIYKTEHITLGYGDVWVFSPYNLEILYLGNVVTDINPALLQDLDELITIKNIGDKDYAGIVIGTQTSSNDLVQLSVDGISYTDKITMDIKKGEEKSLYVKITKNADNHNFNVRDFQLVINE